MVLGSNTHPEYQLLEIDHRYVVSSLNSRQGNCTAQRCNFSVFALPLFIVITTNMILVPIEPDQGPSGLLTYSSSFH
jgi:hypothetical protein